MSRALAPLALLLAGCGFHPVSGLYLITLGDIESDCPSDTGDTGEGDDTEKERVTISEDQETMTIGEADHAIDCSLDGRDFDCSLPPMVIDMSEWGFDAVSTVTTDMTGAWISDTAFDMDMASELSCVGADCASLGLEDCEATGTATGALEE